VGVTEKEFPRREAIESGIRSELPVARSVVKKKKRKRKRTGLRPQVFSTAAPFVEKKKIKRHVRKGDLFD
jgi:hypothetical protein